MGPRRYRRGWVAHRPVTRPNIWSFNGAATLSSRMGRARLHAAQGSRCFNGAATLSSRMVDAHQQMIKQIESDASMGPRRYRRGWVDVRFRHDARGHGSFNGAATLSSRMVDGTGRVLQPVSDDLLQWGRDVIVADGRKIAEAAASIVSKLQWGRDVIVADG